MLLWQLTFIGLFVTAVFGLYLFVGYTFHVQVYYPMLWVTLHVVSALLTVVLFSVLVVQSTTIGHAGAVSLVFTWFSYAVLILTLLSGLVFYVRFNLRRRVLRTGLLTFHLVMAAFSFALGISSMAALDRPSNHANEYPPSLYNYHKHHRVVHS